MSRVWQWFWRGQALGEARAFRTLLPAAEQLALGRALAAQELADRAFDPVDPLRAGSGLGLAISLYREAAYWALLALDAGYSGDNLAQLFDTVPGGALAFAAGGPDGLAQARRALVERSFIDTAELAPELVARDAELARNFVHALTRHKLEPEQRVGKLLLQRGARLLGAALLLLTLVTTGVLVRQRLGQGPDLAAGKAWRASSKPADCSPQEHTCLGVRTDMFFTTNEETDPWLEIDLGRDTPFNTVEVKNRSDCCTDRAAPMLIEVSRDGKTFREVSRRSDPFSTWEARFALQTARYVRLRVPRRTTLHLDKVAVRHGR